MTQRRKTHVWDGDRYLVELIEQTEDRDFYRVSRLTAENLEVINIISAASGRTYYKSAYESVVRWKKKRDRGRLF